MGQEDVIRTFDEWAESGRAEGLEEGHGDVVRQVLDRLTVAAGEKVLDLGCGNGWATRLLAQANAGVQAIGIDASPRMIARAEELHSFTIRARYEVGSFEGLEFPDASFERIFSMEALYYTGDLNAALAECARVLKPGGVADVVVDHFKENPASERWGGLLGLDLHWLGEAEWKAAFEAAGFTNVTTERVVDSRGPGDEASFTPDEWHPSWESRRAAHEAGSLWIHGERA